MNKAKSTEIRKARSEDADAIASVQIQAWQVAYAHIFPPEKLAQLDSEREERAERWQANITAHDRISAFYVAENHKKGVVGFAFGSEQNNTDYSFEAELMAIYILPEYHRAGVGQQLVKAVASEIQATGFGSLMLWVLEDNQEARHFYEKLGGKLAGTTDYLRWDQNYSLVAYGWDDISQLSSLDDEEAN